MSTPSAVDVYTAEIATQSALIEEAARRISLFESMLTEITSRPNHFAEIKKDADAAVKEEFETKIKSIEKVYDAKEDDLSKQVNEIDSKKEKLTELKNLHTAKCAEIEILKESKKQKNDFINSKKQRNVSPLADKLDTLDKVISKQATYVENLKAALAEEEQKLAESIKERKSTYNELSALRDEMNCLTEVIQTLKDEINARDVEAADLANRKDVLNKEIKHLSQGMSPAEVEKKRTSRKNKAINAQEQLMNARLAEINNSPPQYASTVFENIKAMIQSAIKDSKAAKKRTNKALKSAKTALDKAEKAEKKRADDEAKALAAEKKRVEAEEKAKEKAERELMEAEEKAEKKRAKELAAEKKRIEAEAKKLAKSGNKGKSTKSTKSTKPTKSTKKTSADQSAEVDVDVEEDEADQAAREVAGQSAEQVVKTVEEELDLLEAADRAAREAADRAAMI